MSDAPAEGRPRRRRSVFVTAAFVLALATHVPPVAAAASGHELLAFELVGLTLGFGGVLLVVAGLLAGGRAASGRRSSRPVVRGGAVLAVAAVLGTIAIGLADRVGLERLVGEATPLADAWHRRIELGAADPAELPFVGIFWEMRREPEYPGVDGPVAAWELRRRVDRTLKVRWLVYWPGENYPRRVGHGLITRVGRFALLDFGD